MRKAASYEKLFPELHEPHPTRTLEVKDKIVPASFNLDAVKKQIEDMIKNHSGQ